MPPGYRHRRGDCTTLRWLDEIGVEGMDERGELLCARDTLLLVSPDNLVAHGPDEDGWPVAISEDHSSQIALPPAWGALELSACAKLMRRAHSCVSMARWQDVHSYEPTLPDGAGHQRRTRPAVLAGWFAFRMQRTSSERPDDSHLVSLRPEGSGTLKTGVGRRRMHSGVG